MTIRTLTSDDVRLRFSGSRFDFKTTAELDDLGGVIAQDRAVAALEFALGIRDRRFNLFVAGPAGTGRTTIVEELAERFVDHDQVPPDWAYVYNFESPNSPLAISLPAGQARQLADRMTALVEELERDIPTLLASPDFRRRHEQMIDAAFDHRRERIDALNAQAAEHGVRVVDTSESLKLVPLLEDGTPMDDDELEKLDDEAKRRVEDIERLLRDELLDYIDANRRLQDEIDASLKVLEEEVLHDLIAPRLQAVGDGLGVSDKLARYLQQAEDDIVKNFRDFLPEEVRREALGMHTPKRSMVRYEVNVLLDNTGRTSRVVAEVNPTYYNLLGRAERRLSFGALETNHMLITAGALLRASGGTLIVHADELLSSPFAYRALKRCLREGHCVIEDPDELINASAVESLRPEPIPIAVKLIMIGTLSDYLVLSQYDEQFLQLVKVRADFEASADLTDALADQFAHYVGHHARLNNLPPFTAEGVGAVIEHASRLAGRQDEISLRFAAITDLLVESAYWAERDKAEVVDRLHVERAEQERRYRGGLMQDDLLKAYKRKVLLVDVQGQQVGQVNGLAVIGIDELSYGMPVRITAKTFAGSSGVVSIERESDLSGQIHSKAVFILTGYLGDMYAQENALSLGASISYEQNYSIIDGDSASLAETIAIVSSLSGVPVRQNFAITGSMSQHGEVQPVGGINEKIEGFFDVCVTSGLTGDQAVVIPELNTADLNLADRVVEAMAAGQFHVYSVEHVDEAIRLLTGRTPGRRKKDGSFPARSVHGKVATRLAVMSAKENGEA